MATSRTSDRRLRVAGILLAALLLPATAAVGAPTGPTSEPAQPGNQAVDEGAVLATAMGVPESALDALIRSEDQFTDLAFWLQDVYGEARIDAWIDRSDPLFPNYSIRVSDEALVESVETAISASNAPDSVRVLLADGWMLSERTAYIDSRAHEWLAAVPHIEGMHVDIASGEVVIGLLSGPEAERDAARLDELVEIPLRIEYTETPGTDDNRGGLNMTSCTTGLAATRSSGTVKGLLTATHCGTQSWYPAGSSTSNSSTFYNSVHNANADIQGRTISSIYTLHRDVWQGGSSFTPYSGTSSAVVGGTVCSRGQTSGYRCDLVVATTFKPTYSGACNGATCNSVFVATNFGSSGGDSGGGWIRTLTGGGYAAVGIHKGTQGGYSIYSKLTYRPSGWTVY